MTLCSAPLSKASVFTCPHKKGNFFRTMWFQKTPLFETVFESLRFISFFDHFSVDHSRKRIKNVRFHMFSNAFMSLAPKRWVIDRFRRWSPNLILLLLFMYIFHLFYCLQCALFAQATSVINRRQDMKLSKSFASTWVHINKHVRKHKHFSVRINRSPLHYYLFPQECVFNKQSQSTVLHVTFEGSMRVGFCNSCCKRWFFAFDAIECQTANIEARLQGIKVFAGMEYRHVRLEGYCALPAGEVSVELWVEDCVGHQRAPKVPFIKVDLNPRIVVEEISISQIWKLKNTNLWMCSFGVIWIRISDPRSVWIIVHQRNQWIHDQSGVIGFSDAPWSRQILDHWSWSRSP